MMFFPAVGDCVLSVSSPPDSLERLTMAGRWKQRIKINHKNPACPVKFFVEDERSEFNWGG